MREEAWYPMVRLLKGRKFTFKNLTCKRPGNGIPANKYFKFIGKKAKKNYEYDDLINE